MQNPLPVPEMSLEETLQEFPELVTCIFETLHLKRAIDAHQSLPREMSLEDWMAAKENEVPEGPEAWMSLMDGNAVPDEPEAWMGTTGEDDMLNEPWVDMHGFYRIVGGSHHEN